MAEKRVLESELADIDYSAFTEVVLVRRGETKGRTIFQGAMVLAAGRGEPPRGLHPSQTDRLLIEVAGDPHDGDIARAVKSAFGLEGRPGRPFGWRV